MGLYSVVDNNFIRSLSQENVYGLYIIVENSFITLVPRERCVSVYYSASLIYENVVSLYSIID